MKLRPLTLGNLVLRKVVMTVKNPALGKLGPNWEGPYIITLVAGIGGILFGRLRWKCSPTSLECK